MVQTDLLICAALGDHCMRLSTHSTSPKKLAIALLTGQALGPGHSDVVCTEEPGDERKQEALRDVTTM